jgi:uncharacterized protein with beta-barrel porin domain
MAVGWYLRFHCRTATWRSCSPSGVCTPSRHRLEAGSALRPGSQSAPALKAQADECHDSAIVSAGVSVHWTPAIATYVNYDGQLGRNRYDSNAVTGGVRISF